MFYNVFATHFFLCSWVRPSIHVRILIFAVSDTKINISKMIAYTTSSVYKRLIIKPVIAIITFKIIIVIRATLVYLRNYNVAMFHFIIKQFLYLSDLKKTIIV